MSFGYSDSSWLEPPDYPDLEYRDVNVKFNNDLVYCYGDGTFDYLSKVEFDDVYDSDCKDDVIDAYSLDCYVFDAIESYIPETEGKYYISGDVWIVYSIWLYPISSINPRYRKPEYADEIALGEFNQVEPKEFEVNNIKFTPAE